MWFVQDCRQAFQLAFKGISNCSVNKAHSSNKCWKGHIFGWEPGSRCRFLSLLQMLRHSCSRFYSTSERDFGANSIDWKDVLKRAIACVSSVSDATKVVPSDPSTKSTLQRALDMHISGLDQVLVDGYCSFLRSAALEIGAVHVPAASPLAKAFDRWTVLSSPHVHKTSQTQFERRTHRRLFVVYGLHAELAKKLIWYGKIHAPPDIQIEAHLHLYHSIRE